MKLQLQPGSSARKGHLTSPATKGLSLWRESITPSSPDPALSAESRAPLGWLQGWGRTQPSTRVGVAVMGRLPVGTGPHLL